MKKIILLCTLILVSGVLPAAQRFRSNVADWTPVRIEIQSGVRELRAALNRECPGIALSAYVPRYRFNGRSEWRELHQPFGAWLKENLLDRVFPTGYVYDMLRYQCWSKRQVDYCRKHNPTVPVAITIGVGSSHGRILDLEELVDQIDNANRCGADGVGFFRWQFLADFSDGLAETRYARPVKP